MESNTSMNHLTFIFSKSNSLWSKLIRLVTFSKWSHVEYVSPSGNIISAELGRGVYSDPEDRPLQDWTAADVVKVPVTDLQLEQFTKWINKQVGKKYDLLGIFGLWLKRRWQDDYAWFCSELLVAGMHKFKIVKVDSQPHRITPQMMYDGLKGKV